MSQHLKANAEGVAAKRRGTRKVPTSRFVRLDTLEQLLSRLFGDDLFAAS